MVSSGRSLDAILNPGTVGSENTSVDLWTPGYYGYNAWNGDPGLAQAAGGASGTTTCWAFRVFVPKAITLSKVNMYVGTANNTPTAQNATTVAVGSNTVDVTTFVGAQTLNVVDTTATPGAFSTTGTSCTLLVQTSNGQVFITYNGKTATTFTNCTTRQGGTGTLSTGGTVVQSYNTIGVFDNAGTNCIGILSDMGGTAGTLWNGSQALETSVIVPAGTSAAITANSYVWVVYLATGTTSPSFRAFQTNSLIPNLALASPANFRVGRVSAAVTYFPLASTTIPFVPGSLVNSNTASPGYPFVALT
jgi:hypothetical protein